MVARELVCRLRHRGLAATRYQGKKERGVCWAEGVHGRASRFEKGRLPLDCCKTLVNSGSRCSGGMFATERNGLFILATRRRRCPLPNGRLETMFEGPRTPKRHVFTRRSKTLC